MLIAFPDEAITQFRGAGEGWTVNKGFDRGCSLAWDADGGDKDSESLWLLQKMRGNEAQLSGMEEGWGLCRTDFSAQKQLFMLIRDTAPLALPSRGTTQLCLCQSQQSFPTQNIYILFSLGYK